MGDRVALYLSSQSTRTVCEGSWVRVHARPALEPRTSRRPCEHSDHYGNVLHVRPVTISLCLLIRFVPESARNHAGTDETVPLLLAARARTHTEPPNVRGEEKAHGPTGTRTRDLSQTVRALRPLSYRATRSTCDKKQQQQKPIRFKKCNS